MIGSRSKDLFARHLRNSQTPHISSHKSLPKPRPSAFNVAFWNPFRKTDEMTWYSHVPRACSWGTQGPQKLRPPAFNPIKMRWYQMRQSRSKGLFLRHLRNRVTLWAKGGNYNFPTLAGPHKSQSSPGHPPQSRRSLPPFPLVSHPDPCGPARFRGQFPGLRLCWHQHRRWRRPIYQPASLLSPKHPSSPRTSVVS